MVRHAVSKHAPVLENRRRVRNHRSSVSYNPGGGLYFYVDFLLAINGEDSYGGAMTVSHGRFGGFLLHRSALQRRISTGFTSGLAQP